MKKFIVALAMLAISCTGKDYINITIPDSGNDADIGPDRDIVDEEDIITNNSNNTNNTDEVPRIISITPSGVVKEAPFITFEFSMPMDPSCSDYIIIKAGDPWETLPLVNGTALWETTQLLVFTPTVPFNPGDEVSITLDRYDCRALENNKILDNNLWFMFDLDEIKCAVWGTVFAFDDDVTIYDDIYGQGNNVLSNGDHLFVGTFPDGFEVRPVVSIRFNEITLDLRPGNIVAAYFAMTESGREGTYPQDLRLDVLPFNEIIDASIYDATPLFSAIPSTDSTMLADISPYIPLYFEISDILIPMLIAHEEGINVRVRAEDLLFDGQLNIRGYWSSDILGFDSYGPGIKFCYWQYDHWITE